jgi:hypothetical protein
LHDSYEDELERFLKRVPREKGHGAEKQSPGGTPDENLLVIVPEWL